VIQIREIPRIVLSPSADRNFTTNTGLWREASFTNNEDFDSVGFPSSMKSCRLSSSWYYLIFSQSRKHIINILITIG